MTICEIKYTDQEFLIDKSYAQTLQNKVKAFQRSTNTQQQIFLAMIAASGVKKNIYFDDCVTGGVVTLADLFK